MFPLLFLLIHVPLIYITPSIHKHFVKQNPYGINIIWHRFLSLACIESYLGTLVAGLGGSPNMVSGTIIAVSKIIYEYKGTEI